MYSESKIRQRLSISTFVFYGYYPVCRKSLEHLSQSGIREIELLECPDQFDMTKSGSMRMVQDLCDSAGVKVAAYHCFKTNFDQLDSEGDFLNRLDQLASHLAAKVNDIHQSSSGDGGGQLQAIIILVAIIGISIWILFSRVGKKWASWQE